MSPRGGVAVRVALGSRVPGAVTRPREQPWPQRDQPRRDQNPKSPRPCGRAGVEAPQPAQVPPRQEQNPEDEVEVGGVDQPRRKQESHEQGIV